MVRSLGVAAIGGILCLGWAAEGSAAPAYTLFESGQVRPLALSPDKKTLFAVNTPDGRLEVFDVTSAGLQHRTSIPVGVEPVAVAARTNDEVWVVNHVSDSVSVVDVGKHARNRVVRTLLVGDEPRDIVFAGPNKRRAFITTAHRGQNSPVDPQLSTPGVGRADVWVFDAQALGASLGGTPLTILTLFSDTPRALAATPDGSTVYAAAHFSGNRTTTIHRFFVPFVDEASGGAPAPETSHDGTPRVHTGLVVKFDGAHWVDELGRAWDDAVKFDLPDKDVFVIDAMATTPALVDGAAGSFAGVGTTLFNMAVNPVSGKVYVSNTEAHNEVRFEGPAGFADTTVRGQFLDTRITVLDPATHAVQPHNINPHIDLSGCCTPLPNEENELSLATPLDMQVSADGQRLYVAAMGSDKIGVFDTAQLEAGLYWPDPADHIQLSGGGPTGVVLDESRDRLYVLTRFDNAVSVVDTSTGDEIGHHALFSPEPPEIIEGRRFLYDAQYTSSRGDSSCAGCHVFGDMDQLAWDLGNPDGDVLPGLGPFKGFVDPDALDFHPMKGPMTTQSLRGMANHGPMHWRGDRTGAYNEPSAQPDEGAFDENEAFLQFNPAFVSLIGRDEPLSAAEMQAFADFALRLTYPPNPIRALDNSLTPDQESGRFIFNEQRAPGGDPCAFCHVLDPNGNAEFGVDTPGFFGTDGQYIGGELPQTFKIPHFRNLYQKVGRFGLPSHEIINANDSGEHMGPQIRGFGYVHDGAIDTVARFDGTTGFFVTDPDSTEGTPEEQNLRGRRKLESYLLAFDSNMAPIVGQQITHRTGTGSLVFPRIDLLIARAEAGECDLVAHGWFQGRHQGFLYQGGLFRRDRHLAVPLTPNLMRVIGAIPGSEMTYTCVPPGSGRRVGIDRDLDGVLNDDE